MLVPAVEELLPLALKSYVRFYVVLHWTERSHNAHKLADIHRNTYQIQAGLQQPFFFNTNKINGQPDGSNVPSGKIGENEIGIANNAAAFNWQTHFRVFLFKNFPALGN